MKHFTGRAFLFLIAAFLSPLWGCTPSSTTANDSSMAETAIPSQGAFLSFSDLHFNPFAFPGIVDSLQKSPATAWNGIFQSAAGKYGFGQYGDDSNYNLLHSAMQEMKVTNPRPDFIIISGDFLSHDFGDNYQQYTGITNTDSLFRFIEKTMTFVTHTIQSYFPNTAIIPVLGNDDSYCGDYQVEPGGDFLRMMSKAWYPLLSNYTDSSSFYKSFRYGGFYEINNPAAKGHRLIALNSVFYSVSYRSSAYINYCSDTSSLDSAGNRQMAWLQKELEQSRSRKEKIWIVYHIPPGINAYSSSQGYDCKAQVTGFWQDKFNRQFINLVQKYKDVVQLHMAGHSHMDNFQLFLDSLYTPYSFVHVTPAISPIFGNNPAFQEVSYDRLNATWNDYTTYYFNNLRNSKAAKWTAEYTFGKTYGESSVNNASLMRAYLRIYGDSSIRSSYMRYYNGSNTSSPAINTKTFMAYWCAIGFLTKEGYSACACDHQINSLLTNQTGKN